MLPSLILRFALSLALVSYGALVNGHSFYCVNHPSFATLSNLYGVPNYVSSDDPYSLLFSSEEAKDSQSRSRAALMSWAMQCDRLRYVRLGNFQPRSTPGLDTLYRVLQRALSEAKYREDEATQHRWKEAVNDYFDIFDIRGMTQELSGLPFFSLARDRFSDPRFHEQTITLNQSLRNLIERLTSLVSLPDLPKDPSLRTLNIWTLALEACNQNAHEALTLLGLLLSRDSSVIEYFNYIKSENLAFVKAVTEVPVLTRLIVELLKEQFSTDIDFFSYEGHYSTKNFKNYYFWSAALAAHKMRALGYDKATVQEIAVRFSRLYKQAAYGRRIFSFGLSGIIPQFPIMALIADGALISNGYYFPAATSVYVATRAVVGTTLQKGMFDKNGPGFFRRDALEIMKKTGQGANFGHGGCEERLEVAH